MTRPLRVNLPGLDYHVWTNGIDDLRLFRAPDVKRTWLTFLLEEVSLSNWTVLEYTVMTTHYHVLLRLNDATLSSGFKRLNERFAQYYNKLHRRRGHVFDGRFESKVVEGSLGQRETARYIALNPVTARMCDAPEEWPWSSHGALAGLAPADAIVDARAALEPFGGCPAAYRAYVLESDDRTRLGSGVGQTPRG
jgi:REP element-mobilizing transposase RayT